MIRRKFQREKHEVEVAPRGFDDFELRLGDMLRGERATMGKSLLDVQRELRIKASYIAAIENCDPSAFDTPGFIAGYVRSYARYLNMDPDDTFAAFCTESGFSTAHGMSDAASTIKKPNIVAAAPAGERDLFANPNMPFAPGGETMLSRVEPGAIGSSLVLVALIVGIGYGGWSVLQEVQRVQLAPVEQTPVVLSDLDPLQSATPDADATPSTGAPETVAGVFDPPASEAIDRLYRPQALDVPVLVARDAPISTLDPRSVGAFAGRSASDVAELDTSNPPSYVAPGLDVVQAGLVSGAADGVAMVAVRPAWVRVRDAEGATLFEGIMNAGDTYAVPADAVDPVLQVGESSAIYFTAQNQVFGPVGPRGAVTANVALTQDAVGERFAVANLADNAELANAFPEITAAPARTQIAAVPGQPKVLEDIGPGVTIVATRQAWVRVKASNGSTIFESVMAAGDIYNVPKTETPPTIRTGDAGAVYFAVNGQTFGPYGQNGAIADNLALSVDTVTTEMQIANLSDNAALASVVAELSTATLPDQE